MSLKTGSMKPKVTYRAGRKLRPTDHLDEAMVKNVDDLT
jgi:hypothetical protein